MEGLQMRKFLRALSSAVRCLTVDEYAAISFATALDSDLDGSVFHCFERCEKIVPRSRR